MGEFCLTQFSLAGQTALVTGAVRGLGFEIACGFAQAGAQLIVHGRREADVAAADGRQYQSLACYLLAVGA